jgi:large repetitive protein
MTRKLCDESLGEPISPLIDVVMNGFAAMFIILIIFLVVFRGRDEPPPPKFVEVAPSPVIRGQNYTFTFPVVGGVEPRQFRIAKGDLSTLNLQLDGATGTVFGAADLNRQTAKGGPPIFPLTVECEIELTDGGGRQTTRTAAFRMSSNAVPYQGLPLRITHQDPMLPSGRIGQSYETVLGATGGVEPYHWKLASGRLPRGLRLDSTKGCIRGEPAEAGEFNFEVKVEQTPGSFAVDGVTHSWVGASTGGRFRLTIHDRLRPVLRLPTGRVGENYHGALIMASRLPQERFAWEVQVPGLMFSESDGSVTGVPQVPGNFKVSYRVVSGTEIRNAGAGELKILPSLPRKEAGLIKVQGRVGEHFEVLVPYRGLVEPVTVTSRSSLPPGLTIDATRIRGTPREVGKISVPIAIQDATGTVANGTLEIHIRPQMQVMEVPEELTVHLVVGAPVAWRPPVVGGDGRASWSIEGTLPPDLKLENGMLRGSIRRRDTWKLKITVRDEITGETAARIVHFRGVLPEETQLRIATKTMPQAFVGVPFEFVFATEGGVGSPRIFVKGDLPTGLSVAGNGIRGTPQARGDWRLSVAAEDATGQRDGPQSFILAVRHGDESQPTLTTSSIPAALVGVPFDFAFASGGGVGMPSFSFSGKLPRGLKFNAVGISGTPEEVRESMIEVVVADQAGGRSAQRRFVVRSLPYDMTKPEVVTSTLRIALRGQGYEQEFSAEGGIGRYRWEISGELPAGLKKTPRGIVGRVNPEAKLGTWPLRIAVKDDGGNRSAEKTLELEVTDP